MNSTLNFQLAFISLLHPVLLALESYWPWKIRSCIVGISFCFWAGQAACAWLVPFDAQDPTPWLHFLLHFLRLTLFNISEVCPGHSCIVYVIDL